MKILSFGEIIWDIYDSGPVIGGAPLNFAANCAGLGAESYMLSAVGSDALGRLSLERLEQFGVNTDYVTTCDKPTGYCSVTLDERKVPHYNIADDVAYDHISIEESMLGERFDWLYFGTLAQRSACNADALNRLVSNGNFGGIFCDVNLRAPFFDRQKLLLCANSAAVLKISREELHTFTATAFGSGAADPFAAAKLICEKAPNIKTLIITLDSEGAVAYDAVQKAFYTKPSVKTRVISTVGAGDGFSAAFICSYSESMSIETALSDAVAFASKIVAVKDAVLPR